jgi:putative hemolysin
MILERFLGFQQVRELRFRASTANTETLFDTLLEQLNLSYRCREAEVSRIPSKGPAILVANHPFGLADAIVLGALLSRVRSDVKFLANSILTEGSQFEDRIIPVDPFGGEGSVRRNIKSMRRCVAWLNSGGLLVVFPAGEVSAFRLGTGRITEPSWNHSVARLVRITGAVTIPVFVHGTNSPSFHVAGLIHPRLRTMLLPRELLNKRGRTVDLSIGNAIAPTVLLSHPTDEDATKYLRWRTNLLQVRRQTPARRKRKPQAEVVSPVDGLACRAEVEALPAEQILLAHGGYRVCLASAEQIPQTLREIGRLREISFRQCGEGTGNAIDLDCFDTHYLHLFVWNCEKGEIAGAYRLAGTDQVIPRYGVQGLYTSTLFNFSRDFVESIDPALELGRSFVRPEYQKSFSPLLLLWKGICSYVARHPRYRILFGPVSISHSYSPASRALMVSYFGASRTGKVPVGTNIDGLSQAVADLEVDGRGVPVLLRQYVNMGGQVLGFHVDRQFSDALDGLIVVDLTTTNSRLLERYMGAGGAERFHRYQEAFRSAAQDDRLEQLLAAKPERPTSSTRPPRTNPPPQRS